MIAKENEWKRKWKSKLKKEHERNRKSGIEWSQKRENDRKRMRMSEREKENEGKGKRIKERHKEWMRKRMKEREKEWMKRKKKWEIDACFCMPLDVRFYADTFFVTNTQMCVRALAYCARMRLCAYVCVRARASVCLCACLPLCMCAHSRLCVRFSVRYSVNMDVIFSYMSSEKNLINYFLFILFRFFFLMRKTTLQHTFRLLSFPKSPSKENINKKNPNNLKQKKKKRQN